MAIYYLDVDDEITSAATRIRDTSDTRVALVLTPGSRVATSRINFMLLAREARKRGKRLAIVTSDPSIQSVARSADLPVFASVGEYERAERAEAAEVAGAGGSVVSGGSAAGGSFAGSAPASGGQGGSGNPGFSGGSAGVRGRAEALSKPDGLAGAPSRSSGPGRSGSSSGAPSRTLATVSEGRRVPWALVAAGLFVVIVLVSGGLFFLYPSATVSLTLPALPVGPLSLDVKVDPTATAIDDTTATIPGVDKAFPVQASGTYPSTGQQVAETAATGTVTFTSINTVFTVPVVAGTTVSTSSGVAFTTTQTVNVPAATVSGTTITRGTASAPIQAAKTGTAGNVAANAITRLPSDLAAARVTVTNPAATSGGTHTVTQVVAQSDVDAAGQNLLSQLQAAFQGALASPASSATGSQIFPDTAQMGVAICNPDPAGLVGQAVDSFQLSCTATGTAEVADLGNVTSLAERRVEAMVGDGFSLVDGSVQTALGTPSVENGTVTVPVTARASEVRQVSVDGVRSKLLGMSLSDARDYLAGLGTASISMSPSWADTMPSFDFRIDVRIVEPSALPSPTPSASPSGGATPSLPTHVTVTPQPTGLPAAPTPTPLQGSPPPEASESAEPTSSEQPTPESGASQTPAPSESEVPTASPTPVVSPSSGS